MYDVGRESRQRPPSGRRVRPVRVNERCQQSRNSRAVDSPLCQRSRRKHEMASGQLFGRPPEARQLKAQSYQQEMLEVRRTSAKGRLSARGRRDHPRHQGMLTESAAPARPPPLRKQFWPNGPRLPAPKPPCHAGGCASDFRLQLEHRTKNGIVQRARMVESVFVHLWANVCATAEV